MHCGPHRHPVDDLILPGWAYVGIWNPVYPAERLHCTQSSVMTVVGDLVFGLGAGWTSHRVIARMKGTWCQPVYSSH